MPTKTASPVSVAEPPAELQRLHDLCGQYAASSKELSLLQARIDREFLALINRHKDEFVSLEMLQKASLTAIEELARQNPAWFGEKRSIKTPFGTIKLTPTSSLSVANEEKTLNALFLRADRVAGFDATLYFRNKTSLDLEALEKLPDAVLNRLGVVRVTSESFKFTLTVVDVKKTLADSAISSEQAAAA